MPERQKPDPKLVSAAARALKDPKTATPKIIQGLAARVLDSEKNDPQPHRAPKKK